MSFQGKRVLITGASRGIGESIALKLAENGAFIAIAAKTSDPHKTLPGTIHTVADAIEKRGGRALPLAVDIRDDDQVKWAVDQTVAAFGGLDILINNASAISLTGTLDTPLKRFDLMTSVNVRGTFAMTQSAMPHLIKGNNPHVLMLAPPLNMDPKWFKNNCAYTLSKYGMSMCVLGMAAEFRKNGVGVNALWPKTAIATSALKMIGGDDLINGARIPQIVADAAFEILGRPSATCTGNFFIDETILKDIGVTDFAPYAVNPAARLIPDFFL